MREALKHVSITSSVVKLVIPMTISVSILSEILVWVADVLKGGKVVTGGGVVVRSEGMVGKTVTDSADSTGLVLSVGDSSSVVSDRGDSIDGATAVEILAVVVISADVTVVVVLLVEVTVVGAAWVMVVVVVVVVGVVVVDGDDVVSSVVLVCEIVSRCDVWHEKRVVSSKGRRSCTSRENQVSGFCLRRETFAAQSVQHTLEHTSARTEYTVCENTGQRQNTQLPTSCSKLFKRNDSPASGMAKWRMRSAEVGILTELWYPERKR